MKIRMGELLVNAGVISQSQLREALLEQRRRGGKIGDILVRLSFLSEEILVRALSKQLGIPRVDLPEDVDPDVLALVPAYLAEECDLLPLYFGKDGRVLIVATSDPLNITALEKVSVAAGVPISPQLTTASRVRAAIARLYPAPSEFESEAELEARATPVAQPTSPSTGAGHVSVSERGRSDGSVGVFVPVPAAPTRQRTRSAREIAAMQLGLSPVPPPRPPSAANGSMPVETAAAAFASPTTDPRSSPSTTQAASRQTTPGTVSSGSFSPPSGYPGPQGQRVPSSGVPGPAVTIPEDASSAAPRPGASGPEPRNRPPHQSETSGQTAQVPPSGTSPAVLPSGMPYWGRPGSTVSPAASIPVLQVAAERLMALETAQQREMRDLKYVLDVLIEKGLITFDEYVARLRE